uniref:HSF-type DNA-binding domain-containing protein n=1 Tax=Rousettus aegyptiacus TaxID=9407 RepID=A0A7J8EK22_ROUAE|nr:hypothetical protein HJG63_012576 [Rousettus aegyptiacus]
MASQDTDMVDEVDEMKLAPLEDEEPETGDPLESSPDANVDSMDVLETHQDPAVSPDPAASQDTTTSPEPPLSQDRAMSPDSTMSQDTAASPYQVVSQDAPVSPVPAGSPRPAASPYQVLSQDRAAIPVQAEGPLLAASPYQVASQDRAVSPVPADSPRPAASPYQVSSQDRATSPVPADSPCPAASPYQVSSQDAPASPVPADSPFPAVSSYQVMSHYRASSPVPAESPCPAASPHSATSPYQAVSPHQVASQEPAMSPNPGPHENPQPQNPNGGPDNVERNSPLLWLPFTRKLWMIVEDDAFTSVSWNDAGDTVVIKEDLFQSEVLCRRGAEKIFETNSLKSFICLLNLHGFSKIHPRDPSVYHSVNDRIMIFRNANFQRNKPQLIDNMKRKGHLTITDWPGISSTPKKKKQVVAPTRRSLRIQLRQRSKDGDTRAQKTDPDVQASSGTRSFMLPSYVSFDNMTRHAREEPFPSEPAGPSGEGTSGNVRLAPTATAARDGARQEPTGPPDFNSAMSLYNTCCSIPTAALSATAPTNAPEGEEEDEQVEEENSSDYKCALCEHLKTKQVPKVPGHW